jgi:hypothetical protein
MKRHPALVPLSRDHHHALVIARRLRHATTQTAAETTRAFLAHWHVEQKQHFRLEEGLLLPAYAAHGAPNHPAVLRMLLDHMLIRRDADRLADAPQLELLHDLGARLAATSCWRNANSSHSSSRRSPSPNSMHSAIGYESPRSEAPPRRRPSFGLSWTSRRQAPHRHESPAARRCARAGQARIITVCSRSTGVDLGVVLPLLRQLIVGEDRIDRAHLDAGVAVDALLGVDEQLAHIGETGLILGRVNAVNRTNLDAREVLHVDARLGDHIGHSSHLRR